MPFSILMFSFGFLLLLIAALVWLLTKKKIPAILLLIVGLTVIGLTLSVILMMTISGF